MFEIDAGTGSRLPAELARLYDGDPGLPEACVYSNFVATADGAVAIPSMPGSNAFIADESDADRFVVGLLRAYADAVLIGAGVLRASPRGTWRAGQIYPPAAEAFAELRGGLGLVPAPEVAVLTGSGAIDPAHPLFEAGALVLTTASGAALLEGSLPAASSVLALGESRRIDIRTVVETLQARGHGRILCEAGPHTHGELLAADLVDELFLTRSPLLVGDAGEGSRLGLIEAADLMPGCRRLRLRSLRRHGSHVFLRYSVDRR